MGRIDKFLAFLKTKSGSIFLSVLWGLGLACLFQIVCKDKDCIVFKAPARADMQGVFHHGDTCYQFKEETTTCTADAIGH